MSKQGNRNPNGRNRAERRANPGGGSKSGKPVWLRIAIVAVMLIMLLGFFIVPLIR